MEEYKYFRFENICVVDKDFMKGCRYWSFDVRRKKCVNMGVVAVARNMFYQNLLSLWHSGRHRTLVPNKQCIFSCSSFLCWREEQAHKTHGNINLIQSLKYLLNMDGVAKCALKLWVCLVSFRNFTRSEGVILHDSWMHFWWSLWDTPVDHIQLAKKTKYLMIFT